MSIRIGDLASTDFSDVADAAAGKLPALHPAQHLSEILNELGVSQAGFARAIGVSPMRVSHGVPAHRPIKPAYVRQFVALIDKVKESQT